MRTARPLVMVLILALGACSTAPPGSFASDPDADAFSPDLDVARPAIAALGERADDEAVDVLLEIARRNDPPCLAAAQEAIVVASERALARGDKAAAASWAIHVYLSSAPHDLRRRALIVYARGGGEASLDRLEHIVDGRLDARFLDLVEALLAEIPGARARDLERRLAATREHPSS